MEKNEIRGRKTTEEDFIHTCLQEENPGKKRTFSNGQV